MLKDAMGGYRGTATEISRVIAEHPDNAEAYYDRGNARSSCDDYEGAIADFTMALKVGLRFREAITAYGNRGIARVESGDMEGAIQDFSEIIKRKPTNRRLLSTAYKNRALVKEKMGDSEGGAGDRKMAHLLSPDVNTQ
ncbi:MAG: tetratricopeptide repeat protein [Chlorobium sp.]|jgi:tetratricopeptide (TPR) repeat protein|nr:MAG: tetratricopeptide repeat protein [Chlorobium sp.]